VIASPTGRILARAQGTRWGRIAFKPVGQNGFGYDPIFIPKSQIANPKSRIARTFGQLPARLKHCISHRGIALRKIFMKISQFLDIS
jgi:XTP/dITP diphosphohydrolase